MHLLTTGDQIDAVLSALQAEDCNSSFAVSPWHGFLCGPMGGASTMTLHSPANAARTWNRLFWKPARSTP